MRLLPSWTAAKWGPDLAGCFVLTTLSPGANLCPANDLGLACVFGVDLVPLEFTNRTSMFSGFFPFWRQSVRFNSDEYFIVIEVEGQIFVEGQKSFEFFYISI